MSGPSPGQGGGGYYQDPASYYDQQPQHNMNTVPEEDEPVSSPELGRGDQQWDQNQYGYSQNQYDYQQDQSGQSYGQGYGDYGYSADQSGNYHYDDQSTVAGQQDSTQQQQDQNQDQWEAPYYPGYLYDAATNSYVSDPNWQPSPQDDQSGNYAGGTEETQEQGYDQEQYSYEQGNGVGQQDEGGEGTTDYSQSRQPDLEGEDPYANDPYQLPTDQTDQTDPYAQYGNSYDPSSSTHDAQNSYSSQNPSHSFPYDTTANQEATNEDAYQEYGQSTGDDYSRHDGKEQEEEDPFAVGQSEHEQEDPFAMQDQQYDAYAAGNDSYNDRSDPYSQSHDSTPTYSQPDEPNGYAPPPQRDPYAPQMDSNYSSPPPPAPTRRPQNDYRQPRDRTATQSTTASQPQQHFDQCYEEQAQRDNSRGPSNLRQTAASPPPLQPPPSQSSYAPSPQQQQYSSFASVYDAAAQSDSNEPPYDPYAPVPKQSRERAYSNVSNRSRPSAAQVQAQVQSQPPQMGQGGRPLAYDPYSPSSDSLPIAQAQTPTVPPVSPQVQQRAPVPAPPVSGSQGTSSPTLSTSRTSTFSPPPRSTSAQNNPVSAPPSRAVSSPPHQQQQRRSTAAAFDIPPPRTTAPPTRQAKTAPAPSRQAPSQAPPPSRQAPAALAPSSQPVVEANRAKSPAVANRSHESQQSTSSSTSNSSGYIPPPPASATPRGPPTVQKKPSPFGGVMQPPARRAPHQRGASAFGSDSPYGALPTGPLTSAYEPSSSGVEQIKEEAEEEETQNVEAERAETMPEEPQREEDHVPSWMQATSTGPAQRAPPNAPNPPASIPPRRETAAPSSYAPPPASRSVDTLADSFGQVSLQDRKDGSNRRQAPPPQSRPAQYDQREQQTPRSAPLPRQQPPSQAPPPSSRLNPVQNPNQPPSVGPPRTVAARPPPPSNNDVPPPRKTVPYQAPISQQPEPPRQQRQPPPPQFNRQQPARPPVVPQLHFEPPSGEREYRPSGPSRPPPPSGQGSRSSTPVPMMVVEETAEEEEQYAEQEQYVSRQEEEEQTSTQGYEVNDSPDYGDSSNVATGATTPSTTYGGDWQADGYDYVSGTHSQRTPQQEEQRPYDPYAPQSTQTYPHDPYDPRQSGSNTHDDSLTPSISQQASFGSPAGSSSPNKRAAYRPHPPPSQPARMTPRETPNYPSYQADGYAPPQPTVSYSAQPQGQQQTYDPYSAHQPAEGSQQGLEVADLGLDRRTAPLVSFGFGGRILLVFPDGGNRVNSSSAFDPANPYSIGAPGTTASDPSTVHIRKLADILPPSTEAPFPGPIFLDGGKANSGKKRKEALAWLGKRISELEDEVKHAFSQPFATSERAPTDPQGKGETRLLLFKLVKVFIENEGKLVGTPAVDEAVRAILQPASAESSDPSSLPTADQLAAAASNPSSSETSAPFVTYGVSSSDLDEMSSLLLRGERREAVRFALDHKMWAHAFIIASCVDTDCWKDVTVEFLRSELTPSQTNPNGGGGQGREALRVAYSMFAGLGAESIEQFLPPRSLSSQGQQPQLLPPAPIGTSQPNRFDSQAQLPQSTLESWRDTVGMIVANRTAGDSAALTALGDALASNGWIEASHVCYLLSPQTSLAGGLGSIGSRISLVGSIPAPDTGLDLESIKLTELVEFGCSLTPTVKGQEQFTGFAHLQAFRLFHASVLAESGNIPQALKYTEAVVNTLKLATRPSPFYHPRLVAQVKSLGERLGAAPGQKETSSWIARKVPRPTVNSLWSTFEGGFNKFVSGEGEATPEQLAAKAEVAKVANGQPIGPFSHFSAIAPDSNSGTLSRAQSSTDLAGGNRHLANQPPSRPLSAAAPLPPTLTSPQSNKPVHSPGPPPVKRAPFKTHHARSSSLGAFAGYDFNPTAPPPWQSYTPPAPVSRTKVGGEEGADAVDSSRDGPSEKPKPQFAAVEDRFSEDDSGFISPMAQYTPSVSPTPGSSRAPPAQNLSHRRMTTAEELADLGIGNSKSKKPAFDTLDEELEAEEGGGPPPARPENGATAPESAPSTSKLDDKPTIKPSKSWLGGWFKREASPAAQTGPGPVKANLGEQKTFYYDEKLKRWVNNSGKGGDETPPAIVPPPRASTASPSRAMRGSPRFGSPAPPVPPMPPQRSQTTGPPPLSRSATSSDLRSQSQTGELRPPSRPSSAADGPGGARGGARRNKPKYVVVPP
ncbi:uncharacterized protein JCM6883_003560 [Sporobolomyces salmoneus]|uniref:uncharacterized protein n=1 Tax=Sporobolomyces salmoneus TaxID=183962 RepID=UPI003173045F